MCFFRNIGLVLLSLCKGEMLPLFPAFALNFTLLFFDVWKKKTLLFLYDMSFLDLSFIFYSLVLSCYLLVMLLFLFDHLNHLAAGPLNCPSGSSSGNSS
jgi:hypothetical protein